MNKQTQNNRPRNYFWQAFVRKRICFTNKRIQTTSTTRFSKNEVTTCKFLLVNLYLAILALVKSLLKRSFSLQNIFHLIKLRFVYLFPIYDQFMTNPFPCCSDLCRLMFNTKSDSNRGSFFNSSLKLKSRYIKRLWNIYKCTNSILKA